MVILRTVQRLQALEVATQRLRSTKATALGAVLPHTRVDSRTMATTSPAVSDDFLRRLPKTDLHVHLDGSLRIETLMEIAQSDGIKLPATTVEGLRDTVFRKNYADLNEYLTGFQYTTQAMRKRENLERIAYEFACDNYNEGVKFFEIRFAPQLLASPTGLSIREVLTTVHTGLERATVEYNNRTPHNSASSPSSLSAGTEPLCRRYGIIVCAMRWFNEHFSDWYKMFLASQAEGASDEHSRGKASQILMEEAVKSRDVDRVPVVALDIAGAEGLGPATEHTEAFATAKANLFGRTVHAGEAAGPASIYDAVVSLHANRIGHGTKLFSHRLAPNTATDSPQDYCQKLGNYMSRHRIPLEVCIKSNLQTMPELGNNPHNHPLAELVRNGVEVAICTDNRLVSDTNTVQELRTATDVLQLDHDGVKELVIQGARGCFFPGSSKERKEFLATFERCVRATEP